MDPVSVFSIECPGSAHQEGKGHGTGKIAGCFGNFQSLFCKGRCPLADCLFTGAGTKHHSQQNPEQRQGEEFLPVHFLLAVFYKRSDRNPGKGNAVAERERRPEKSQDLPAFCSEKAEKKSGEKNDSHMSPAVEGMEHTHGFFLVSGRTGFYYRAYQHFEQPAANGIDHDRDQDSGEGGGQQFREQGEQQKSGGCQKMGSYHGKTVADSVYESHCQQIYQKLDSEIKGHQKRDLGEWDVVGFLESQKEKGDKIINYSLNHIGSETGGDCFAVLIFHGNLRLSDSIWHLL